MRRVFSKWTAVGLIVLAAVIMSAVATASRKASIQVCVLLPETKTSVRWVQFDAPDFAKALKAAGVTYSVTNALGDAQKQKAQAERLILIEHKDAARVAAARTGCKSPAPGTVIRARVRAADSGGSGSARARCARR